MTSGSQARPSDVSSVKNDVQNIYNAVLNVILNVLGLSAIRSDGFERAVITAGQMRAARALLGIDQRKLAGLSGLSLPTIQRMEASGGVVRGNVVSLMKLVGALDAAGIALIGEGDASARGGRGVRLKEC